MKKSVVSVVGALAASVAVAWEYDQVDKVDSTPLETLIDNWRPAKAKAPRKVLYFSDCFGYNHHGGRCYGDWTFARAGEAKGAWTLTQLKDVRKLGDKAYLAGFDAIVFCNSSGLKAEMAPGMEDALVEFVEGGKGIALIHAGLDAFKDSDRLLHFFGGYFRGHPWHGDGTWRILNEAPADPLNAPFRGEGVTFSKIDEIYQFPAFFDRSRCKVLLSMDLGDPVTKAAETWWADYFGPGSTRADHDYAVTWTREPGKGRVFYTSFGHDRQAFLDWQRLYHMFAGLQWVLGDLERPDPVPHGPAVAEQRTDWANGPHGERLTKAAKDLKGQALDFVFCGDSITMGWTYPAAYRYPGGKEVWERHFGKMKTLNLGMSGDRTEHLLWRVTKGGQADGWTAKAIFVMIGINNHGQTRKGATAPDTPAAAAEGAKAIVEALRQRHPESKIVLLGALPWASNDGYRWVREYNAILKTFAGGSVVFRDYGPLFMESAAVQKKGLFTDGLHPSPAGYEIFADAMEKTLGEIK